MAGSPVFLDTNILIYGTVKSSPFHVAARSRIDQHYEAGDELWISRQVLREYLAIMSRPQQFSQSLPISALLDDIRYFESHFRVADEGPEVTAKLLELMARIPVAGKQVHDANIVATMLANGIPAILIHNVGDFDRFSPRIGVIPLLP